MKILPAQESRMETGVVKFGDDWAGLFIRGDDAMGYAAIISAVMNGAPPELLSPLRNKLWSCDELPDTHKHEATD